ncbi:hypothetical protein RRF57_013176 [Xylaria bambusicola]|uniref:Uncharacterized protein n=1 Tax=Xylaria bambusicola TaxID=326684 RepID=A0AAN7ZE35_9PEZI
MGTSGGRDRLFLPDILVSAFRSLIKAFCLLHNHLETLTLVPAGAINGNPNNGQTIEQVDEESADGLEITEIRDEPDSDKPAMAHNYSQLEKPSMNVHHPPIDTASHDKAFPEGLAKTAFKDAENWLSKPKSLLSKIS